MNWLYEALLRASKDSPKPGDGTRTRVADHDGESLLATIESLSSLDSHQAKHVRDIPTSLSPRLPLQGTHPESGKSSNGFRHLSVALREESRLVFQTDPHGLAAEQFRRLRRTLNQEFVSGGVLIITSPSAGDGKTLTSVNLCACLADSGDATLLVEADVRHPTAIKILGCAVEPPGIEDAWTGKVEPSQSVHFLEEFSLHAAMIARIPDDPSHLVNGAGVKSFLAWARGHFRWVVLDAPPVLPAADVADLLPLADAVLLVVRAQSTPRELSRQAFEMLGKRLRGVILNEATIDSHPYYGYLNESYQGSSAKKYR